MKALRFLIITLIIISGMMSCEPENPVIQYQYNLPVIESFITAQSDTIFISIKEMIPYNGNETDTVSKALTDLDVYLIKENEYYYLSEKAGETGQYFLLKDSIDLLEGDSLAFECEISNFLISGTTLIPTKPAAVKISNKVLYYEVGSPGSMMNTSSLILSWDNQTNDFYYVSLKNIEESPELVNDMLADAPPRSQAPPSKADQFEIRGRSITYFGTYEVILYHVNQEFADLFDNPSMNSVSINEPPTNINKGLGIFTGFSSDTVYFEVKRR